MYRMDSITTTIVIVDLPFNVQRRRTAGRLQLRTVLCHEQETGSSLRELL